MTTRRTTRGFVTSLNKFLKAATWLGPIDAPAVASLKAMAKELDSSSQLSPSLLSQYGLSYRSLLKRAPAEDAADAEFERLLAEGQA